MSKILILVLLIIPWPLFSQQYTIEQYLNIRGAGSPEYSPDDSKIYFSSTVTGSSQVWMVEKPGGWPFQITYFKDRVSSFNYNPKVDVILMEKDEGGSEYDQFYLLKPDGTLMEQISITKPKVLYSFGRWFDDGSAFTYFSNERNLYYNDIYRYNINTKTSEELFSSDNSNYPSIISPDGKMMIVNRSYSSFDNDLILLNIESKEFRTITTHNNYTEGAEFYGTAFSEDSKKIYINTNYRNEYFSLHEYDISSGVMSRSEVPFTEKFRKNDLSSVDFSSDRSKIFLVYNSDGYDAPVMYDFKSKSRVELPAMFKNTNIASVQFGNVSSKILIGINSSKYPSSIYQWDYSNGKIEQVTYPNLAGIDTSSFVEPALIKYKTFDKLQIPAFIYYPKNISASAKLPCIISIHGGPEGQARYGFNSTIQYFVNAGYIVVEPNVRGSTGYGKSYTMLDNVELRENSVKDIAYLVAYLKSTGKIDADKIAVMGGSYGGYMVLACMTLFPRLFAAGVEIVGIANFITFLQNTAEYRRYNREGEYGSLEKNYDLLKSISPVNKVDSIKSPLMIIHGKNDPRVPVGEATQMYDAITKKGGTAELLLYDDEGHGIAKLKNRLDAYPKIVQFLDKYLKK